MDRLSRWGLPRGSVALVLRARAARLLVEEFEIYPSYRRGARAKMREARGLRRRRREGVWGTCPVASSMASGGMSALGSRGRARPGLARVAKTASAQARVCFELNAAVAVVAVLVLRHTSSSFSGQSGLCVAW